MPVTQFLADFVDAIIPLAGAVLLLARPQWFTKRDLNAAENKGLAIRFRRIGWALMAAGVLILIANIGSTLASKR